MYTSLKCHLLQRGLVLLRQRLCHHAGEVGLLGALGPTACCDFPYKSKRLLGSFPAQFLGLFIPAKVNLPKIGTGRQARVRLLFQRVACVAAASCD